MNANASDAAPNDPAEDAANIYQWCAVLPDDRRLSPHWTNQPVRGPRAHEYWRHALPPGPRPDPGNETDGIGSGFPAMATPLLKFEHALTRLPAIDCLLQSRGVWLCSGRLKRILEDLDAAAFEFAPTIVQLANGAPGPDYWLCDIVRFIDAVDAPRSGVSMTTMPSLTTGRPKRSADYPRDQTLWFKPAAIQHAHVWRALYQPTAIFCDAAFAQNLTHARVSGLRMRQRGRIGDSSSTR